MKHLKGYTKRYFSLAIIAVYSSLHKLTRVENAAEYHLKAMEYQFLA